MPGGQLLDDNEQLAEKVTGSKTIGEEGQGSLSSLVPGPETI